MSRLELRNQASDWPQRMTQADIRDEFGHRCEPGCGCPNDPWQSEIASDPDYPKRTELTDEPF